MSLTTLEQSTDSSRPSELFLFEFEKETWSQGYTNARFPIDFGDHTYLPVPIDRDSISFNGDAEGDTDITIQIPKTTALIQKLVQLRTPEKIKVTIYRIQHDDPSTLFAILLIGFLDTWKINGSFGEILLAPSHSYLAKTMLTRNYSIQCPYILYGDECLVNKAAYAAHGSFSSANGTKVVSSVFAQAPNGYFQSGFLVGINNAYYFIVHHEGDTCHLNIVPYDSVVANTFVAYPGCPHCLEQCDFKFHNALNFGGDPWMPGVNLFETGL